MCAPWVDVVSLGTASGFIFFVAQPLDNILVSQILHYPFHQFLFFAVSLNTILHSGNVLILQPFVVDFPDNHKGTPAYSIWVGGGVSGGILEGR